jgi:hypothetical protein
MTFLSAGAPAGCDAYRRVERLRAARGFTRSESNHGSGGYTKRGYERGFRQRRPAWLECVIRVTETPPCAAQNDGRGQGT